MTALGALVVLVAVMVVIYRIYPGTLLCSEGYGSSASSSTSNRASGSRP
jgi:hypothetical protein